MSAETIHSNDIYSAVQSTITLQLDGPDTRHLIEVILTVAERFPDLLALQQQSDLGPLSMLAVAVFVGDGRRVWFIRVFSPNFSILLRLLSETPHIAGGRLNPLNSAM